MEKFQDIVQLAAMENRRRIGSGSSYSHRKRRHIHPTDMELENYGGSEDFIANELSTRPGLYNEVYSNRLMSSTESLSKESMDSFHKEVAEKTKASLIGHQEAEIEVFLDRLVKKEGNLNMALIHVVSEIQNAARVQVFVNTLLNRGANPSTVDKKQRTALHYATQKNLRGVCSKLLEKDAIPNIRDKEGITPLTIALENENDEIASLILLYIPNHVVRGLFISDGHKDAEFSFHDLLKKNMEKTVLAILDCMADPCGQNGQVRVYYQLLEADDKGRAPDDPLFNPAPKSALQIIAKKEDKTLVFHDVVRLLIRHKWKTFVRFRFQINTALYLFTLFAMVFSLIVATMTPDPMVYDDGLHYARAVFEVWCFLFAIYVFLNELNQLKRHKLEYFQEAFNFIDSAASILLLVMLPLRLTNADGQWQVFATAYIFWVIRIFKFAAVFRQTGAYTQILWRIVAHDFPQFMALFAVILLAFSGSFLLSLRGENALDFNSETSTFWWISFVGVRVLAEAQPVIDYAGVYPPFSCFLMVVFIFACCVVLLNILIAQLSDTYQNIQRDAQRGLEVNRALIVARSELNSLRFGKNQRQKYYIPSEDIMEVRAVLSKWETPPLNELNKSIQDILDNEETHKLNQLTLQNRLARQETALLRIQEQLDQLLSRQNPQSS